MDIVTNKVSARWKKPIFVASVLAVILVVLLGIIFQSANIVEIESRDLLLGKVRRGDLQVAVDGYGVLRSYKQTLLTTLTAGTVEEILLRPGAKVEANSIILRLGNVELLQETESAAMALSQEKANLRKLKLDNERELLAEESTLAQLDGDLQAISLRSVAERDLAGGAVSQMAYKITLLQEKQAKKRLRLQLQRIEQLKKVMQEAAFIQQEKVNQVDIQYKRLQANADRLVVRAGMQGVLQRLPIELGQSVVAGQELALVGSDKDLLALIRISQSKAEQLQVGQTARVQVRREDVPGVVTRVAPEVQDGAVEVEITFTGEVPSSARPELNVDAKIIIKTLSDVLYMERPVNAQGHSEGKLYKVGSDTKTAVLYPVSFGEEAERFIEIIKGANEHEQFILSDLMRLHGSRKINLTN